jgi:murein L,D-transpeptidase YcbB/YkuD
MVAGWNKDKNDDSTNVTQPNTEDEGTEEPAVVYRDMSIDSSNAYSDLFLDSTSLEAYIKTKKLSGKEATDIRNFYNARNFQYAWFTTEGFTEQGRGFWNLYNDAATSDQNKKNRKLNNRMDSLLENDTLLISPTDTGFTQTEFQITQKFLGFAKANLSTNNVKANAAYYLIPAKKEDAMTLADSLLNKQKDTSLYQGNTTYNALKQKLAVYYNAAKNGTWQTITAKGLKKGAASPMVSALKKRLAASGDYITNDTTAQFNDSLDLAIKDLQVRIGQKPTGIVSDSLIRFLNVPVEKRVEQLIVNMNRALWMPAPKDSNYIQVNVPAFTLYAFEGSRKAFDMPVVVGKEGTNTMMFTGDLNQIVFSPYWNIPASIVEREILPAIKKDKDYLKKHNMEIVSQNDSLPVIRQLPGDKNSLGRAKFLFPNSYDIYFHDTPAKEIFAKQNRAASHGCIRLANSEQMAIYLLRNQSEWTTEKIKAAMNSDKEQKVAVSKSVPVFITYYTAWADENGNINFRDDIYGHDEKTSAKMFTAKPVTRIS